MDVQTCQGKRADGSDCQRTQINNQGFCYQHVSQAGHSAAAASSANSEMEDIGNSNNDSSSSQQEQGDQDMPRCSAVAATTRKRCKKLVSFASETFCPAHGGKQNKVRTVLPMCQAISKRTGQACKNHVSIAGQTLCSHHGGSAKTTTKVQTMMQVTQGNNNKQGYHQVWAAIQSACLDHLTETHPQSQCKCTKQKPCKGLQMVAWFQKLAKLATASGGGGGDILQVSITDLAMFAPTSQDGLFGELFLAVKLFGADNIAFLPTLFDRIHKNVLAPATPPPPVIVTTINKVPRPSFASTPAFPAFSSVEHIDDNDDDEVF